MTTKGAYSKKHQYLEKEHLRKLQDHAKKADRERVHRFSKQTAQRQRALEEKKLAMAAAEEERRKKALEDRHRAQKEATDRFKSAFSRMKSSSKGASTNMRNKQLNIEYYLPNKQATKLKPSSQKLQSSTGGSERVAIGKEVEVNHRRQVGLQKRTSSLDDVLNQLRGEHHASSNHHGQIQEQGHILVHKGYYSQQNADGRIIGPGALIKGRSASDSSLNITRKQPPVEIHHSETDSVSSQPVDQTDVSSMELKREANSIVVMNASDENIVFHPVTNKSFQPPVSKTTPQDDLRITSPELADSSSSSDLSNRSSSPFLEDSLDSNSGQESVRSASKAVKLRTKHRQQYATHSHIPATNSDHTGSHGHHTNHVEVASNAQTGTQVHTHTRVSTQSVYTCEESDSSSSSDSPRHHLPPRPIPPRSRRQARQPPHHNTDISKTHNVTPSASTSYAIATVVSSTSYDNQQQRTHSKEGVSQPNIEGPSKTPKIVGILKKSSSQSSSKVSSAATTACSSRLTSAATSMLMEGGQTKHTQDRNHSTISENASTKSLKRVRFKDQAESEKGFKPTIHDDFIDSARIELWKRVLPNGFSTHFLPNSAFTPKMKVSLSPKQVIVPSGISGPPRKPNGITVHVPVVPVESSPSPPNMKHANTHSESGEEVDHRDETKSEELTGTLKERYERLHNGDESQLKVSPTNVESSSNNSADDHIIKGQGDHVPTSTTRALDKTPTDDDINEMWDEIRNTLHENKKVSVSPQVFNFRVPVEDPPHQYIQYGNRGNMVGEPSSYTMKDDPHTHVHVAPASRKHFYNGQMKQSTSNVVNAPQNQGSANSGRQLVHRQNRARTMRCRNELHSPVQMWNRHNHNHAATYPHTHQDQATLKVRSQHPNVQRESELTVRVNSGSSMRNAPTALSLEEQKLMQSIEKLDQRMKDHLGRPQNAPVRMSHVSPEPPDFIPEYYPHPPHSSMPPHPHPQTRGPNNLPKKSRIYRNTTKAVQNGRLMNNSTRTQYRHVHPTAHRQVLYNK